MTTTKGTESSAYALLRIKRVCKGDDSVDLGRAKEKDRASQEEDRKVKEDAAGPIHQRVATEDAATDAHADAEARPMRTEEAAMEEITMIEVVTPRTATDKTVAGVLPPLGHLLA
jgi:hypothetical protein